MITLSGDYIRVLALWYYLEVSFVLLALPCFILVSISGKSWCFNGILLLIGSDAFLKVIGDVLFERPGFLL